MRLVDDVTEITMMPGSEASCLSVHSGVEMQSDAFHQ